MDIIYLYFNIWSVTSNFWSKTIQLLFDLSLLFNVWPSITEKFRQKFKCTLISCYCSTFFAALFTNTNFLPCLFSTFVHLPHRFFLLVIFLIKLLLIDLFTQLDSLPFYTKHCDRQIFYFIHKFNLIFLHLFLLHNNFSFNLFMLFALTSFNTVKLD